MTTTIDLEAPTTTLQGLEALSHMKNLAVTHLANHFAIVESESMTKNSCCGCDVVENLGPPLYHLDEGVSTLSLPPPTSTAVLKFVLNDDLKSIAVYHQHRCIGQGNMTSTWCGTGANKVELWNANDEMVGDLSLIHCQCRGFATYRLNQTGSIIGHLEIPNNKLGHSGRRILVKNKYLDENTDIETKVLMLGATILITKSWGRNFTLQMMIIIAIILLMCLIVYLVLHYLL